MGKKMKIMDPVGKKRGMLVAWNESIQIKQIKTMTFVLKCLWSQKWQRILFGKFLCMLILKTKKGKISGNICNKENTIGVLDR